MYSWVDIARRTEKVYNDITSRTPLPLIDRLKRYYGCGAWAGKLFCLLVALDFLLLLFLEFCFPGEKIDVARDWPKKPIVLHQNGNGKGKGKKVDRVSIVFGKSMGNGTGKVGNNF
jgi:phosphatidylinositol glycan class A protein